MTGRSRGGQPSKTFDDSAQTEKISTYGEVPSPGCGALLRVLGAASEPEEIRVLPGRTVRIGSGPASDLVINDKSVSRVHATACVVDNGVRVSDEGSRNGVWYFDQRFTGMDIRFGSRVRLGRVEVAIEADTEGLLTDLQGDATEYHGLLGQSGRMRRLFSLLRRLEGTCASVLIEGESGVGKEVVARAIHDASSRRSRPMVTVDCGALPRHLVESELFGHLRGAFTGATDRRLGAFFAADGGTLFLDEIGELPLELQPALLRAVETGEVKPVGADVAKTLDVRVLAATNRDLDDEVARGRFRRDLFFRLAVVRIRIPPLSERVEDIEPLAHHFASSIGVAPLPTHVLAALMARSYPGNARELRNAVGAWAATGDVPSGSQDAQPVGADDFLFRMADPTQAYSTQKDALVDRFTAAYLRALLAATGGNQSAAARVAQIDRTYLARLMAKHRITIARRFE